MRKPDLLNGTDLDAAQIAARVATARAQIVVEDEHDVNQNLALLHFFLDFFSKNLIYESHCDFRIAKF